MIEKEFKEELKKIGIECNENHIVLLDKYYELLIEWNNKINLTTITDKKEVYLKHFYDSLTIVKAIDLNNYESLCDVGTGAGFPGIVLKIFFPNLKVTLIDALNKRIIFLNDVINKLNLKDIKCIHARSEEYGLKNREKYDITCARAVANLSILLEYLTPITKKGGYIISLKGDSSLELENSKNAIKVLDLFQEKNINFLLPYENSKRCILVFKKLKNTNLKYPRKYSEIKKRAL